MPSKISGWVRTDFLMEDYFPVDSYKIYFEKKVNAATSRHDIDIIGKSKGLIQKYYMNFSPEQFNNFQQLVDKIISTQTNFYEKK